MKLNVFKKKTCLEIFLDDELFKICDRKLFQKKLPKHMEFKDKKEALDWFNKIEKDVVLGLSYNLLGKKNYHSSVLKRKLMLRKFSCNCIDEIIGLLKMKRFLDDNDWIKFQIEKAQSKQFGPRKIFYQLYLMGIEKEEIQKAIDKFYPPAKEKNIVEDLKIKYQNKKDQKQLYSFLKNKGFNLFDFFD